MVAIGRCYGWGFLSNWVGGVELLKGLQWCQGRLRDARHGWRGWAVWALGETFSGGDD